MRIVLIISMVALTTVMKAQPESLNNMDDKGKKDGIWTVYYGANGKQVGDSANAVYYRYTFYVHGKDCYPFEWGGKNDKIISSTGNKQKLLHGEYKIVGRHGLLKSIHVFNKGEYVSYRNFYPSGQLHEYCNFTNHHVVQGVPQPHSYCKRVYDKDGSVKYFYRRNPMIHGPRSFEDSDYDSTVVTNVKQMGDTTFATVTRYIGNNPRVQSDQFYFQEPNGEPATRLHGNYTAWYLNGQKKEETRYHYNRRKGVSRYWERDGTEAKPVPDMNQLNQTNAAGEKVGWWITYLDSNFKVLKDSVGATHCMYNYYTGWFYHYNFGNAAGTKKCPIQFPENDTLKLGNYTLLNGDYVSYYKSGNMRFVISTSNGIMTEWKHYYPNGQLHWHAIYSEECGAPIRTCVYGYDKDGKRTYNGALMVPQDRRKYRMM